MLVISIRSQVQDKGLIEVPINISKKILAASQSASPPTLNSSKGWIFLLPVSVVPIYHQPFGYTVLFLFCFVFYPSSPHMVHLSMSALFSLDSPRCLCFCLIIKPQTLKALMFSICLFYFHSVSSFWLNGSYRQVSWPFLPPPLS